MQFVILDRFNLSLQGFMTAALQNHARKTRLPIDRLQFTFHVLQHEPERTSTADAPAGARPLSAPVSNRTYVPKHKHVVWGLWFRCSEPPVDATRSVI